MTEYWSGVAYIGIALAVALTILALIMAVDRVTRRYRWGTAATWTFAALLFLFGIPAAALWLSLNVDLT